MGRMDGSVPKIGPAGTVTAVTLHALVIGYDHRA